MDNLKTLKEARQSMTKGLGRAWNCNAENCPIEPLYFEASEALRVEYPEDEKINTSDWFLDFPHIRQARATLTRIAEAKN